MPVPWPPNLRVEDVEAGLRLDVGQVELVAEGAADGAGHRTAEQQGGHPQADDELAVVVAPRTESGEHGGYLPAGVVR